jgi:putative ABC transport system substrate-binding protein
MKYFILVFVLICLAIVGLFTFKGEECRIAILTPTTHPSLEQIEKGFVDTMEKHCRQKFTVKTYNALGNKSLMRSEAEEIALGDYDLVFTIATQATRTMKEVFEKKKLSTPIVFSAVSFPIEMDLVASEESSGNQLTGVKETTDFAKELEILRNQAQTVLLVYDPSSPSLTSNKEEIEMILNGMGIGLKTVEIFKTNEILLKTAPFMEEADAVLVIKDNTVISGLDVLVKLCDQKNKLLIASDLDSPDRGVPYAYGVSEVIYGEEAAKKALLILDDDKLPRDIPITAPPSEAFVFKINEKRLKEIGFLQEPQHD